MKRYLLLALAPTLLLALLLAPPAAGKQHHSVDAFTGTLVNTTGVPGGSSAAFELHIFGYTDDAELARLTKLQTDKGETALQDALFDHEMGYVRIDHALGYPVGLVRSVPNPKGGRAIVAVMDRPLQLFEIWEGLRSRDYPMSVIELNVDTTGTGTGQLHPVAKVNLINGHIDVDSLSPFPFKILNVKRQK